VGRDPSTDLAVVKINANNLPTLEYADSDKARVGEWVLAVGILLNT
jgi:serine protease Do